MNEKLLRQIMMDEGPIEADYFLLQEIYNIVKGLQWEIAKLECERDNLNEKLDLERERRERAELWLLNNKQWI